jgi:hypothetical protein
MIDVEIALRSLLAGYAPLTQLVGAAIYVGERFPQNSPRKAVLIYPMHLPRGYTMQGPDAVLEMRAQIFSRHKLKPTETSEYEVGQIAEAVAKCLTAFRGTVGNIRFQLIEAEMLRPAGSRTSAETIAGRSQDFLITANAV